MKSGESLLIGRYSSKVGAKGRVAVPVKLRGYLDETAIISQGYEKSLLLVNKSQWENLTSFLQDKPLTIGSVRDTERFLFGSAYEVEFDEQGRIVVPQELREFSGLNEEAIFLGVGNRIEIWSKENWSEYQNKITGEIEKIAERLEEKTQSSNNK